MRKITLLLFVYLSVIPVGSAQNLDKLLTRAQGYLEARAAGNKQEMSRYIPVSKRALFLDRNPPPMSKAQLDGFDFNGDLKTVVVRYHATFTMENVGSVVAPVKESWTWDGRDWFLKLDETGKPFPVTDSGPSQPTKPLPFELLVDKVDLGKHVQGETATRVIDFKSDKATFDTFTQNATEGLLVTGPTWVSDDHGQFQVVLDTTLLNAAVNYHVDLKITGWQGQKVEAKFDVTADVESRLRFSQVPEIIDPATAGSAEIQIQNLTNVAFKPTSLILTNAAYEVSEYGPNVVEPGKTLKIVVKYKAQPDPVGSALTIVTSPGILSKPTFVLPLNVKLPVNSGIGYTKEELEEMKRSR